MRIKFWKENKLSQEYELSLDEIKSKYREYLEGKELSWIEYYGHQTVIAFIQEKDGLFSVTDKENYEILQEELKDIRYEFYKT